MYLAEPDDPCTGLSGPGQEYCSNGGGSGGGGGAGSSGPADSLDPLQQLAHSMAKAAAWVANKVGAAIDGHALKPVDFTNPAFVRQYAIVFAASVFVVLLLWLGAVAKRAVNAVPLMTAIGEAVGLLWLAVIVTAFSPLALYIVVGAASGLSRALSQALGVDGSVFKALGTGLEDGKVGGGPVMLIIVSLLAILLCGAVLLLMVLRSLALYVGALLGIPIHAGLVDKDMWGHSKKWAAAMVAIIGIEPALVIVIGLSAAVQASGNVVTGLGVTAIALVAVVLMMTKLPAWGESVKVARQAGRAARTAGGVALGTAGAATGVRAGINTHGGRAASSPNSGSGGSGSGASSGVSGGMTAHGNRGGGDHKNSAPPRGGGSGDRLRKDDGKRDDASD